MSRPVWLVAILMAACWGPGVLACTGPDEERHVLLNTRPTLIPKRAILLEVDVPMSQSRFLNFRGGLVHAKVRRVLMGAFAEPQIDPAVAFHTSCESLGWPGSVRYVVGFLEKDSTGAPLRSNRGRLQLEPVFYYDSPASPEREQQVVERYD